MTLRTTALALSLLMLGGCVTYPDITQSRSPCRSDPGGWCDFVREAAVEAYPYAMLSSNAYEDEDTYTTLPPAFEERQAASNDDSGLAYSIFDRFALTRSGKRGNLEARVIAFRGTDAGSFDDIFSGSFGEDQRAGARAVYASERAELDQAGMKDVKIEVTGHSLGGALATQISVDNPYVRAFVFNTSPFFSGDPMVNDSSRLAIAERGEFLRLLRRYQGVSAAEQVIINCNPSSSAGSKHSIRALADCLTWIAAYDDARAAKLLAPNVIVKPEVECGDADKVHPGASVPPTSPCVHQPRPEGDKD